MNLGETCYSKKAQKEDSTYPHKSKKHELISISICELEKLERSLTKLYYDITEENMPVWGECEEKMYSLVEILNNSAETIAGYKSRMLVLIENIREALFGYEE